MNSVSDIYLFSSLSFSVYYVFKSRMCNLTFEFILHLYSFFVVFYPPVEGLCCRPKYWANIIHRFDDQNSVTSKCIENWALFEILKHSQRSALSVCTRGPRGVPNAKPSKASSFQSSSRMRIISTLNAWTYIRENISFSRRSTAFWEVYPQLSARGTLYDNSVYGNWLRPKGIAKLSGILEGKDFNIKSIYERLRKGPKKKD